MRSHMHDRRLARAIDTAGEFIAALIIVCGGALAIGWASWIGG